MVCRERCHWCGVVIGSDWDGCIILGLSGGCVPVLCDCMSLVLFHWVFPWDCVCWMEVCVSVDVDVVCMLLNGGCFHLSSCLVLFGEGVLSGVFFCVMGSGGRPGNCVVISGNELKFFQ